MANTLQTNLNAVMAETGFEIPLEYASSANPSDVQMLHLANRAAQAILEYNLTGVRKFDTITMTTATAYDLADDFHAYIPDTLYVDGQVNLAHIPVTPEAWAFAQSTGATGAILGCRFIGGQLQVINPLNGEDLKYEYVSNEQIQATGGGSYKTKFTADNDVWLLDDDLLQLETKWRFEKAKGLPTWQATEQECRNYVRKLRGRDGAAKTLYPAFPVDRTPRINTWV